MYNALKKENIMFQITAIRSSIYRATNLRHGSGISRLYHNSKIINRRSNIMAGINALFAFMSAHNKWWFNTRNIPSGEKYECSCPKCGILLKRKKV